MLKDDPPAQVQRVIDGLITHAPDHAFDMDYHICSDIGLVVTGTNQQLPDLAKELVTHLEAAVEANIICQRKFNNSRERAPFFHYVGQPNISSESGEVNQDVHA